MRLVLLPRTLKEGAMQEEGRAGKALRQGVSHVECACTFDQREYLISDQIPDEVPSNVDVTRELSVHLVVGDRDAHSIVLPNDRRSPLLVPKSSKHRTEGHHLLPAHAGSDVLRLRGAQRHAVLSLRLPGHWGTVHTQYVPRHRFPRVRVGRVIRVHPSPQDVGRAWRWRTVRQP